MSRNVSTTALTWLTYDTPYFAVKEGGTEFLKDAYWVISIFVLLCMLVVFVI